MTRVRFTTIGSVCLLGGCLPLVGTCVSPGPSPLTFGVRRLQHADPRATFQAAEDALIELGYRIDRRVSAAGALTTYPIEGGLREGPVRGRARLGAPGPTRRIAQIRIEEHVGEVATYCRVAIQEQTTETHRMQADDLRASDSPGYTPIDREAGTTRAQNTVWRTIRRDKGEERRILTAIEQRVGGGSRDGP